MSTTHKPQSNTRSNARDDNKDNNRNNRSDVNGGGNDRSTDLRNSPMMAYLLDNLEKGTDIGHYGRLTFTMVARHFLSEDALVDLLMRQPDLDEERARGEVQQIVARDYNPPKRERILEWQAEQEFPICPNADDPASCNVYRELRFPDGIYDNINEFHQEQAAAQ